MKPKKKVLILTYYWPPSGGSGVQRWMYFAKYLAQLNFEPVIITVHPKWASYRTFDESFLEKISHLEVHHTKTFELLKLYSFLTTGNSNKGIPQGNVGADKKGVFGKISRYIRANIFVPDARVGWNTFALKKARELMKKHKFDWVITTGPPHSTHLIGLDLKKEFEIKWLADLRDPWSELFYNKDLNRTKRAIQKDTNYEFEVLDKADAVVTVGPSLRELLVNKLPRQVSKFHFIYNGFDTSAIEKAPRIEPDIFTISYIGILSSYQPFVSFSEGLEHFCEKYTDREIRVQFIGDVDENIQNQFMKNEKLSKIQFLFTGRLEHSKALEIMKSSHLLVNLLANMEQSNILISGKMMEYIATGNAILSIGDTEGDAAKLLSGLEFAQTFNPKDIEQISSFIDTIFSRWKSGQTIKNNTAKIEAFSRYQTTVELSKILENQ